MDINTSQEVKNHWVWLLVYGVLLVIVGVIAISIAELTTLISVFFLGALLIIGGIIICIHAIKSWRLHRKHIFLYLIMGILYIIAGVFLFNNPIFAAVSLTLLLAIFYLILGVFRLAGALFGNLPHKGWALFNGIVTLILGVLIITHWPASSLFIIGLFVGIDLVVTGWTYIMLALASRIAVKDNSLTPST